MKLLEELLYTMRRHLNGSQAARTSELINNLFMSYYTWNDE